jgi:hypothetical protein
VWALFLAFDDHLAMEERDVLPLLRAADAWGELRANSMLAEHAEQRRAMLELVEDTESDREDTDAIVRRAVALVASFRADMELEEKKLAPAVFDGGVVRDQEDG